MRALCAECGGSLQARALLLRRANLLRDLRLVAGDDGVVCILLGLVAEQVLLALRIGARGRGLVAGAGALKRPADIRFVLVPPAWRRQRIGAGEVATGGAIHQANARIHH
jgi:hypothetical protein